MYLAVVCGVAQICKLQENINLQDPKYYTLSSVWDKQCFLNEEGMATSLKNLRSGFVRKKNPRLELIQGYPMGTCSPTEAHIQQKECFIIWNSRLYPPFTVMHFEIYLTLY